VNTTELGQGRTTLQLPAGPVAYREHGEGHPVVLLHGLLTDGHFWDRVTPHLHGVRAIMPDLPLGSHRLAMPRHADLTPPGLARLVVDLMAELGLRDAVLAGADMGGALAQLVAARHRSWLGALVLCSCDAFEHFFPRSYWYLQAMGYLPGSIVMARPLMAIPGVRRLGYKRVQRQPVPRELADYWLTADYGNAGVRRDLAKVLRGVRRHYTQAAAEQLRDFDRPVRLVWADTRKIFPVTDGHRLAQMIPHARLTVVPNSYAHVAVDAPQAVAAAINDTVAESAETRQPVAPRAER
jgi:pimeloyl-ACP methyl ester carboxylesterase